MSEEEGRLLRRVDQIMQDFEKLPDWEKKLIEKRLGKN